MQMSIIQLQDQSRAGVSISQLRDHLRTNGFAIARLRSTTVDEFLWMAKQFGDIQSYPESHSGGILELTQIPDDEVMDTNDTLDNYQGKLPLHSDGAYLSGFRFEGEKVFRVGAPKIVLLQCVTSAPEGGHSLLLDGKKLFSALKREDRELFDFACSPSFYFFRRDGQLNPRAPIFRQLPSGHWAIQLYILKDILVEKPHQSKWERLANNFLYNPRFVSRIAMRPGQVLILDNFRTLHGRTKISLTPGSSRHYRRLWILNDEEIEFSPQASLTTPVKQYVTSHWSEYMPTIERNSNAPKWECGFHDDTSQID